MQAPAALNRFWDWFVDAAESSSDSFSVFDRIDPMFTLLPTLTVEGGSQHVPFEFRKQTLVRNENNVELLNILSACNVYIFSGSNSSILQSKENLQSGEAEAFVSCLTSGPGKVPNAVELTVADTELWWKFLQTLASHVATIGWSVLTREALVKFPLFREWKWKKTSGGRTKHFDLVLASTHPYYFRQEVSPKVKDLLKQIDLPIFDESHSCVLEMLSKIGGVNEISVAELLNKYILPTPSKYPDVLLMIFTERLLPKDSLSGLKSVMTGDGSFYEPSLVVFLPDADFGLLQECLPCHLSATWAKDKETVLRLHEYGVRKDMSDSEIVSLAQLIADSKDTDRALCVLQGIWEN